MRFLRQFIPALVAGLLATTTLTTSVASACGGYIQVDPAPRVLAVSSHSVLKGERWTHRAFVVLEQSLQPAAEKLWALLAPGTYDATRIKLLSRLAQPMEVTLVGPSGARVVKTDKQVGLTGSWHIGWDQTRVALEVPVKSDEQFAIAIAGRAPDARWHEIDYRESPATATWWLHQQGVKDARYVGLRTIAGTRFDIVEYSENDVTHLIVRDGDRQVGVAANATALGAVTTQGRSFVVVRISGQIGLLELPKTTKA